MFISLHLFEVNELHVRMQHRLCMCTKRDGGWGERMNTKRESREIIIIAWQGEVRQVDFYYDDFCFDELCGP